MPHPRRKIRDAVDADHQLAAARAAGMTNRDWALRNGICGRSLHIWSIHRDRPRAPPAVQPPRFVELVPAKDDRSIRVIHDDLVVELPLDCGAEVIAFVVTAVRGC